MNTQGKHTAKKQSAQLSRIIEAAAFVAQARLLVLQERRETLSGRKAHLLGTIAESLEALVCPLERVGRTLHDSLESVPVEFAPKELVITEVAL